MNRAEPQGSVSGDASGSSTGVELVQRHKKTPLGPRRNSDGDRGRESSTTHSRSVASGVASATATQRASAATAADNRLATEGVARSRPARTSATATEQPRPDDVVAWLELSNWATRVGNFGTHACCLLRLSSGDGIDGGRAIARVAKA